MSNKPLVSIAIPTYNRAKFLERLLSQIVPQANNLQGLVEICISNNGSTDGTREIIMNFKERYPGLIKYNEYAKNLGFDANVLEAMKMSRGDFVWTFGDDDLIVSGGIKKVIDFISQCEKDTGLVMLSHKSYFIDKKTGKEVVYFSTLEKDKPNIYKIDKKDIMGTKLVHSFISTFLFNNIYLQKILNEEPELVKKAAGEHYMHTFLHQLMLLKYPQLQAVKLNDLIIGEDLHIYEYGVEYRFYVHYVARKKLNNLLLSSKYMNDSCKEAIIAEQKYLARGIIKEMGIMKAFGVFNYSSFFGCIKLFFRQARFWSAFFFSALFVIFFITPAFILKEFYKNFIRIKFRGGWREVWFQNIVANSMRSNGEK